MDYFPSKINLKLEKFVDTGYRARKNIPKIGQFRREILKNVENIALQSWRILNRLAFIYVRKSLITVLKLVILVYTEFANFTRRYFHAVQYFATKLLSSFINFKKLFPDVRTNFPTFTFCLEGK